MIFVGGRDMLDHMRDEPENLMLVYLRRLDAKIDRIGDDVRELKMRMTTMEQQVASLAATQASHYASLSTRFDRLEGRVERIERRLDLVDIRA